MHKLKQEIVHSTAGAILHVGRLLNVLTVLDFFLVEEEECLFRHLCSGC